MRGRTKTLWAGTGLLLALACATPARTAEAGRERERITGRFEPVQRQFTADEPILVDFIVKNEGDQPFEIESGGDYRRAGGRHERFNVEVIRVNGKPRDQGERLGTGDGLGARAIVRPGETHRERMFLNPWDDFSTLGKYVVTCRRVLTRNARWTGAPGWLTGRLETHPMDITRPDARQRLLDRYLGRRPETDAERAKIISAIDTYLTFPQVQTTFEFEVVQRDPAKLRAIVAGLEEDSKVWPTAHRYVQFLAAKLGVETQTRTERGIGNREIPLVKADLLKKLDEELAGAKTRARLK